MRYELLAMNLRETAKLGAVKAQVWAWRIENEYPEELRFAAEKWAENGQIPDIEIAEVTFDQVLRSTKASVTEAFELMYVLSRDPYAGTELFQDLILKDSLG
jgi:hypothetical protein